MMNFGPLEKNVKKKCPKSSVFHIQLYRGEMMSFGPEKNGQVVALW